MKKNKWITPDDYHFEDILACGRCLWCGRLAISEEERAGRKLTYCGKEHRRKILSLIS